LSCTYIYTFEGNQLFYNENTAAHDNAARLYQAHPDELMSYLS